VWLLVFTLIIRMFRIAHRHSRSADLH